MGARDPCMTEKRQRTRPAITLTLDADNIAWLRSWGQNLSLSRKVDSAIWCLREQSGAD